MGAPRRCHHEHVGLTQLVVGKSLTNLSLDERQQFDWHKSDDYATQTPARHPSPQSARPSRGSNCTGAVRVSHIEVVPHRQVGRDEKIADSARPVGPQQFRNRRHPRIFGDHVTDSSERFLVVMFAHPWQVIDRKVSQSIDPERLCRALTGRATILIGCRAEWTVSVRHDDKEGEVGIDHAERNHRGFGQLAIYEHRGVGFREYR